MDKTQPPEDLERLRNEIGHRVMIARKAKGLTQRDLAKAFGISLNAFSNYEHGREIKGTMLVKLADILECSVSWLLGVSEEGQHLEPQDPLMVRIHAAAMLLNNRGKRKVADYAEDMTRVPEMTREGKSAVPDNPVSEEVA